MNRDDLSDPATLRGIADALYRLHQLRPEGLPEAGFFELLHHKWGVQARDVLHGNRAQFPPEERALCEELSEILSDETHRAVMALLPEGPVGFCHNDTYHGNVMRLTDSSIKLLDFEFACLNHRAFDFSNLFAETTMRHGLADYPYFSMAEPEFSRADIATLVGFYLDNGSLEGEERRLELDRLVGETERMLPLSDYMYAMAGLPLALAPIQKLRFIPYSHARFQRFRAARSGGGLRI